MGESIFSRLKALMPASRFPMEDYLTELAAFAMEQHPSATINWLRELGITGLGSEAFLNVQTQYHCTPDEETGMPGKIPDIVLHLSDAGVNEVIFIESKVASDLSGADQLQLYARILSGRMADRRTLLFISRDYLPQDPQQVLELVEPGAPKPHFVQTRWWQFCQFWKQRGPGVTDSLSDQLFEFMKEQNFTQETQLTPHALAALGGFHQAFDVLRAVLDDELRARVQEISGSVRDSYDTMTAVAREKIFVLRSRPQNVSITIGFWLPADEGGYPYAFGDVSFGNKSTGKGEIITALREFAQQNPSWESENLTDVAPGGRIVRERSLASFLGEPDHVAALRAFFKSILDEITELRRSFPQIQWQAK